MKIDRHISELLYEHDCVIVPSFGGFLASYQPSQFQSVRHTFYPPSKKIAFNVFLKNNDGLLANYISHKNNINYAEALKAIERFRINTLQLLESGKRITLEDVGTLFYDSNKKLQFVPDKNINYLEEAFGLPAVQSPPVKREEQRQKIERKIHEATSIRSSVKPPRGSAFGKRALTKKVLNSLFIAGALLWFSFNVYLVTPHHKINVGSLNPFSYSPSTSKVEASTSSSKTESVKSIPSLTQVQIADVSADQTLSDKQTNSDNSLAIANAPKHKEEGFELQSILENQKNFFIIAGVFREPGNAERLVESLRMEGFAKAEIVNPESSIKKVSYSSFAYQAEALAALKQLHSAGRDAWILKK